ncbi:Uncharacterised protein [Bordetella pertussis]|nr:Uncharacterised protein [Bordetella pertussis]
MAPAASTTSPRAWAYCSPPPSAMKRTPTARRFWNTTRATRAPVRTFRLPRSMAGRRKPLAVFQRTPRRWLTSK